MLKILPKGQIYYSVLFIVSNPSALLSHGKQRNPRSMWCCNHVENAARLLYLRWPALSGAFSFSLGLIFLGLSGLCLKGALKRMMAVDQWNWQFEDGWIADSFHLQKMIGYLTVSVYRRIRLFLFKILADTLYCILSLFLIWSIRGKGRESMDTCKQWGSTGHKPSQRWPGSQPKLSFLSTPNPCSAARFLTLSGRHYFQHLESAMKPIRTWQPP